ncbi:acyl-CoA dehydrogenase family protein [Streptomyces sp. NPDC059455]|uniref:acyl-CoA dehydrogenase family protein n=1 Tax=Streptomyces sp. NPDC059455 TaxID=3346837 RepID=UPI0036A4A369
MGRAVATTIRGTYPDTTPWSRDQLLEIFGKLRSTGYLGPTIPEEANGAGLTLGQFASLTEGIASAMPFLSNHSVQRFITAAGSPQARQRVLPGLLEGTSIGAVAVTEPRGGSSIKNPATTVVPGRGGGLVRTGRKDWVTHAMTADTAVVLAADEQGRSVRVLVDLTAPGVKRRPLRTHGLRHLTFGSLEFHEVEVERWPRLLAYHAATAVHTEHPSAAALASGAKAHACTTAVRACTELLSMCAGHGLDTSTGIAAFRNDAEMLATADGTGMVNCVLWGVYVKDHLSGAR